MASAVFGTLEEMLREVIQGQDPRSRIEAQPMSYVLRGLLRSGAGTVFGDYLFGEFDRHGRSILASAAGPTYGRFENIINLRNEFLDGLTKGKWSPFLAGTVHEMRSNIPFIVHRHVVDLPRLRLPRHVPLAGVAQSGLPATLRAAHETG